MSVKTPVDVAVKHLPTQNETCKEEYQKVNIAKMVACLSDITCFAILQGVDNEAKTRIFASYIIGLEKFTKKLIGSLPPSVMWQRHIDYLAKNCDILEDGKSIYISDDDDGYGVSFGPCQYNVEEIDEVMRKKAEKVEKAVENLKNYNIDTNIKGES